MKDDQYIIDEKTVIWGNGELLCSVPFIYWLVQNRKYSLATLE